jgi:hypothetical protein
MTLQVTAQAADSPAENPILNIPPKPAVKDDIMFYASFSTQTKPEISVDGRDIILHGSEIKSNEGLNGRGALFLSQEGYAEIGSMNVFPFEGTISFWFKPVGDPVGGSHTYMSWAWQNGGWPYMVFSQGWWEGSGGAGYTYFVFENYINGGSKATDVSIGKWAHFTIAWKTAENGVEIKIYQNGLLHLRHMSDPDKKNLQQDASIKGNIYLGADLGSSLANQRRAHGYINNLYIYSKYLSDEEVKKQFLKDAPEDIKADADNPFAWMNDAINNKPKEKRDAKGNLLESRAIMDEGSFYLNSKGKIDKIIDRIYLAGYNVIVTCVNHGRGAEYFTEFGKMSDRAVNFHKEFPNYNPYEYFIQKAHEKGIEVHSWFCVFMNQPLNKEPAAYPEFAIKGDDHFYNGYDPGFRGLIVNIMADHAKNYKIDGVNLDFIRLGGGLDTEIAAKEYFRIYKRNLNDDRNDAEKMAEFASYCVSDVVKEIRGKLNKLRDGIIVSISGTVQLKKDGFAENGRNPNTWLDQGWIDVAYIMDYFKQLGTTRFDVGRKESLFPEGYVFIVGNYEHAGKVVPREAELVAKLIDYCRRKYNDGNGVATYIYSMLSDEQIKALRAGPFKELSKPSWKTNPPKADHLFDSKIGEKKEHAK